MMKQIDTIAGYKDNIEFGVIMKPHQLEGVNLVDSPLMGAKNLKGRWTRRRIACPFERLAKPLSPGPIGFLVLGNQIAVVQVEVDGLA